MKKRKKRKRKLKALVYTDQVFRTVAGRDKKTGKFKGRKRVKGFGDRTPVRRVSRGGRAGFILGRGKAIRGDKRKRAHVRRL